MRFLCMLRRYIHRQPLKSNLGAFTQFFLLNQIFYLKSEFLFNFIKSIINIMAVVILGQLRQCY